MAVVFASSNFYFYPNENERLLLPVNPLGKMGLMLRKINRSADLQIYHEKMPVNYYLQEFVSYPLEVSVFYYRYPRQQTGTITGFLKKEFLEVTGDGRSTLWQLILGYSRVR